jgi:hypothetical protein
MRVGCVLCSILCVTTHQVCSGLHAVLFPVHDARGVKVHAATTEQQCAARSTSGQLQL